MARRTPAEIGLDLDLRARNAITVRALGADLLVVHVQLQLHPAEGVQRQQPVAEQLTTAAAA